MVKDPEPLVGATAREWLKRAREMAQLFGGVVGRAEQAEYEIRTAVDRHCTSLQGAPQLAGSQASPLVGAVALVFPALGRNGPVEAIERWAPQEAALIAAARWASAEAVALRELQGAAASTSGRIRWAFTGKAARDRAVTALSALQRKVSELAASGAEANVIALLAHPPQAPVAAPFHVDPTYVLGRAAVTLGRKAPSTPRPLIGQSELQCTRELVRHGRRALENRPPLVEEVQKAFQLVQRRMVATQLADIPARTLKDVTEGRIRFKSLEDSGYTSVADVLRASSQRLAALNGISETSARQVMAAARQVEKAIQEDLRFRIDLDRSDALITRLIVALHSLLAYDATLEGKGSQIQSAIDFLAPLMMIEKRAEALALLTSDDDAGRLTAEVQRWAAWYVSTGLAELLPRMSGVAGPAAGAQDAWDDFEKRSADYYAALGRLVDLKLDDEASAGFMPKEIVDRVHAQALDDSFLRVSLRGYQSFGARYALVQRRVILGDEMGLGKTVQALAVMAHLHAGGQRHFLVVCPASVLINWVREIRAKTTLIAFHVHGAAERNRAWAAWQGQGGVAVTTYDTLRSLAWPKVRIALLTVDEAHYVKNPTSIRAQQIVAYADRSERTLFMTGTPMENRVGEFQQLVEYLQPEVAARLSATDGLGGGRRFREKVAPAYLRRNTADVLSELPAMVQTDEWEEFSASERAAYRAEVVGGSFMGMRRVAFIASPKTSAKLARLREITQEAAANGLKVIVFSYFRDVLDVVSAALGPVAIGPITGSVPAGRRQQLVDEFTRRQGPAVLVSQIAAGGVGLNMQAGSVVVLCEPQVKPSLEAQAIARAHRMGQVRTVQVHRLLITNSVDQRMVEILDSKQQLFDEYARGSDIADLSPEAVDVSEKKLAQKLVAEEQARLAQELADQLAAEDDGL